MPPRTHSKRTAAETPMTDLKVLLAANPSPSPRKEPLWKGPEVDGVTQSLLSAYLCCPERFRIKTIEGVQAVQGWDHRMGYGNLWHTCEEAHAENPGDEGHWRRALYDYAKKEVEAHPQDQQKIVKWYQVCLTQFPIYVDYWAQHPDTDRRKTISAERTFKIPYRLPSGRTIVLRGKADLIDYILEGPNRGVWLHENKAKGDVKVHQLQRQLTFDLQTMTYLTAMTEAYEPLPDGPASFDFGTGICRLPNQKKGQALPIRGVRYNVIRRPLSGGRHSIEQGKGGSRKAKNKAEREKYGERVTTPAETDDEFYGRLGDRIRNDSTEPDGSHYFFSRWNAYIEPREIAKFRAQVLDPVLENLCDDYEWWAWCKKGNRSVFEARPRSTHFPNHVPRHYRLPFGIYNVIAEGGSTDLDGYLETGSMVGLEYAKSLFRELE